MSEMSDTQGSAAAPPPDDREQWRAMFGHRLGRGLLAMAALVLVVIAATGGFRRAQSLPGKDYRVLGAGQRVETGAFALVPLRAWQADAPPGTLPRAGKRYLVLRLRAENRTDIAFAASALLQQDVVWLPDGRSNERKAEPMRRADDHTLGVVLQPALPVVIDLAWEVPVGETLREPPTFGVYARHYVERGYLQGDGDAGWRQGDPLAKLALAIAAAPPEQGR